ncbi:MAG: hypothetical protein HKN98_09755 [Silicimonas sp.]|nr:hypothetical protein [Silicimonas sp.]NNF91341.1 hypothetical protein [Boseongicola sp.]RZW03700.1 MAG: hypothetical protein EX266_11175 [Paracoccaceae bacterium]NND20626.1 hypothetical protein [Silicimonas sp.]NNL34223.1 hypothetical protein [Silicimonas sp.]
MFPRNALVASDGGDMIPGGFNGWGAVRMPKRFRDFLMGTDDAVPGDYILALIATLGMILAIVIGMV